MTRAQRSSSSVTTPVVSYKTTISTPYKSLNTVYIMRESILFLTIHSHLLKFLHTYKLRYKFI